MRSALVADIIASLFIFLFVYASASKLFDFNEFRIQLMHSPLLGMLSGFVAFVIPLAEIIISIMLLLPKWRLRGLYASFSMMVMFAAYIIAITQFSEYVPCSCGGILAKMNWNQHLLFNIGFIILAVVGIFYFPDPAIKSGDTAKMVFT